jgi:hypothetical protein
VAILDLGRVATPDIQDLGLQGIVDSLDPAAIQDFLVHQGIPGPVLQAIQVTQDKVGSPGSLVFRGTADLVVPRDTVGSPVPVDILDIQDLGQVGTLATADSLVLPATRVPQDTVDSVVHLGTVDTPGNLDGVGTQGIPDRGSRDIPATQDRVGIPATQDLQGTADSLGQVDTVVTRDPV